MFFFEKIEVPEIALLGVGRNFSCLSGARREVSYLFIWWVYFESESAPSFARSRLNFYLRGSAGEAWDGARRRIVPRGSC